MKLVKPREAYDVVAEVQKKGRTAVIDMDCCFDTDFASEAGIDLKELLISQPDNCKDVVQIFSALRKDDVNIVVFYSPNMIPLSGEATELILC